MGFNWGGAASGAMMGAPFGLPGVAAGGALGGLFGGGGGGGGGQVSFDWPALISKYSYMPQYTGQTEQSLFDLFQRLTGQGNYGSAADVPFDIGLPTTDLYDATTRGIKEDYLGTPGGPEGGRIADTRAYYNNLGIPEQAINQERLANQDMNNLLSDQAAVLNENTKNRLYNVLGLGSQIGGNLYGQNLAQHRANTGAALTGAGMDLALQESIRQANQQNANDSGGFLGGLGGLLKNVDFGGWDNSYANVNMGSSLNNPSMFKSVSRSGSSLYPTYSGTRLGGSKSYSDPFTTTGNAKLI